MLPVVKEWEDACLLVAKVYADLVHWDEAILR